MLSCFKNSGKHECVYRISDINSISVHEAGIYSHMTTESPTEVCWMKKYLLWLKEALTHGRTRNEMPLNKPIRSLPTKRT